MPVCVQTPFYFWFWRIELNPTINLGVIDVDASLSQHILKFRYS
ncbi:hypothetical protein SME20J_35440 [Serratia marcescens]|nr:hypothetical protein SME20J_35440 [Serratia marcescens]